MEKNWGRYLYYIVCGVIMFAVLVFVPMLGSPGVTLQMLFPTTAAGWITWSISKGATVAMNLMILHCLIQQGKLNVSNTANYIAARDLLTQAENKEEVPQSPSQHYAGVYGKKMVSLSITTVLSLIGFGSSALVFSLPVFIAQLISVVIAVSFGVFQMKQEEDWWSNDYLRYAKYYTMKQEQKKNDLQSNNSNTSTPSL